MSNAVFRLSAVVHAMLSSHSVLLRAWQVEWLTMGIRHATGPRDLAQSMSLEECMSCNLESKC